MKNKEIEVLNLFTRPDIELSSKEIGTNIHKDDPSGIIRALVYFEYLEKTNDEKFKRTNKVYDPRVRKNEAYTKNYEIVLNKIFTGSHLEHNLGHEIINFIKDEKGQRYVYLNPWGARGDGARDTTEYVFHIIESSLKDENRIFELVGVSKIDRSTETFYEKGNSNNLEHCPRFANHSYFDIFYCGSESNKAYFYTYKASHFYRPNDDIRIIFKINQQEASTSLEDNVLIINLVCNPQHSIAYADNSGKLTYSSQSNSLTDKGVLKSYERLWKYLVESDETIDLNAIDSEQCFSVISGRAQLEVSTSNQIAYFLGRDQNLLYSFLHDFCGIDDISRDEKFEIVREKEKNIDLLFKSRSHVVVVENKIDSNINGLVPNVNANGKHDSQLSKYYAYIEETYHNIPNRKYYVLAPEYNEITRQLLDNYYEKGNFYVLKNYRFFYRILNSFQYRPLNSNPTADSLFMFDQFKKSIEFLTLSKGKQREKIAYIRLKQRIQELDSNN